MFFLYNIVDKTLKCIVIVHRLFIFHTISCIKSDASIIKIISVNQAKEAKFVFSLKKGHFCSSTAYIYIHHLFLFFFFKHFCI